MSERRPEPRWVPRPAVLAIHASQIREHGGSLGIREEGLLDSALDRPRNRWHYDPDADVAALAAAYAFGIAKNHAFVDGNKRTAFQVAYVFLGLNGHGLDVTEPMVVEVMEGVAAGRIEEEEFAEWVRAHIRERT